MPRISSASRQVHGRSHVPTREASSRGRPNHFHMPEAAHDHAARTGRQRLAAARHNSCTAADPSIRPRRFRPATGQDSSAKTFHPSDPVGRTRKLSATIVPTVPIADHDRSDRADSRPRADDRPNGLVDPKPFLKPVSSPMPAPTY
ncbi:unnamed protein product [Microthlaspi erraticum]|uniref:Uncharacterized protein n=1 Tax=Microthlaspi erraticum TaxID=1685480 RepID=A0A6D2K7N1_9BRAS|nr:unnamed protein product [Microthlaspi erraticum]